MAKHYIDSVHGLSSRLRTALRHEGVLYMEDALALTNKELRSIPNLGSKSILELKSYAGKNLNPSKQKRPVGGRPVNGTLYAFEIDPTNHNGFRHYEGWKTIQTRCALTEELYTKLLACIDAHKATLKINS